MLAKKTLATGPSPKDRRRRHRRREVAAVAAAAALTVPLLAAPGSAGAPTDSASLQAAVSVQNIMNRLKILDGIGRAKRNRAAGSVGYDASLRYAEMSLRTSGYQVSRQDVKFRRYQVLAPSALSQQEPAPGGPVEHSLLTYSGSGEVTAPASVPTGSAQGCAAADFGAPTKGSVALVQRGTCTFAVKAENALAAGARAVVVYNNAAGALSGTLGDGFTGDAPVLGVSQETGAALVAKVADGLTLSVSAKTSRTDAVTQNLIAESPTGDPDNVVMAGAHLDSVEAGAGINDNGSGTATLLEVAHQMREVAPKNKLRFALWAAEEIGLVGSTRYVESLSAEERKKIALYLNFDMVGSPNYVRFVYDGDNSAFPPGSGSMPGPKGSGAIEKLFHDYFKAKGLPSAETAFNGRSDYGPFIAPGVDIPSGGLFTGAEGLKTPEQAAVYGGTAGEAYDKCYHQACDDFANINRKGLKEMSGAVAHAVWTYAFDTGSVTRPVGPARGTTAPEAASGGLHHDHHVTS